MQSLLTYLTIIGINSLKGIYAIYISTHLNNRWGCLGTAGQVQDLSLGILPCQATLLLFDGCQHHMKSSIYGVFLLICNANCKTRTDCLKIFLGIILYEMFVYIEYRTVSLHGSVLLSKMAASSANP